MHLSIRTFAGLADQIFEEYPDPTLMVDRDVPWALPGTSSTASTLVTRAGAAVRSPAKRAS